MQKNILLSRSQIRLIYAGQFECVAMFDRTRCTLLDKLFKLSSHRRLGPRATLGHTLTSTTNDCLTNILCHIASPSWRQTLSYCCLTIFLARCVSVAGISVITRFVCADISSIHRDSSIVSDTRCMLCASTTWCYVMRHVAYSLMAMTPTQKRHSGNYMGC